MSKNLELLEFNHTGRLKRTDGAIANYGVIRTENSNLVHYTGKGLRKMFKQSMNEQEIELSNKLNAKSEEELIQSEHIAITPFVEIDHVID